VENWRNQGTQLGLIGGDRRPLQAHRETVNTHHLSEVAELVASLMPWQQAGSVLAAVDEQQLKHRVGDCGALHGGGHRYEKSRLASSKEYGGEPDMSSGDQRAYFW